TRPVLRQEGLRGSQTQSGYSRDIRLSQAKQAGIRSSEAANEEVSYEPTSEIPANQPRSRVACPVRGKEPGKSRRILAERRQAAPVCATGNTRKTPANPHHRASTAPVRRCVTDIRLRPRGRPGKPGHFKPALLPRRYPNGNIRAASMTARRAAADPRPS